MPTYRYTNRTTTYTHTLSGVLVSFEKVKYTASYWLARIQQTVEETLSSSLIVSMKSARVKGFDNPLHNLSLIACPLLPSSLPIRALRKKFDCIN